MSIKTKIALLFAILVTIILSVVSISVYLFSVQERELAFSKKIVNRAMSTAQVYAGIHNNDYSVLERIDLAAVASLHNRAIVITSADGDIRYSFAEDTGDSVFLDSKTIERIRTGPPHYFNYKDKKAVGIFFKNTDQPFIVVVAASDLNSLEYLGQLKKILLLAMLAAALLSFFTGHLFAINLIRPIKDFTGEVRLISTNNLSRRIETSNTKNELNTLAITFNELMDRLQDSFAIQRRFISNASHELSTPLTSISSQLEVALQKSRSEKEYQQTLQSVYEDIRDLQQLTKSLLDIAKTGSQGSIDLAAVRVDDVLFKVVADVQKQNNAFKAVIDFDNFPDEEKLLTTFGNANLLYIAFKNIIENGCKYADNNLSTVAVQFKQEHIIVKVANTGDVIAEADIHNIFQPFFRTNSAISKPGFGLGLTLTRRILLLHKGVITVESDLEIGTVFTIQLPNILFPPPPAA